MSEFFKKPEPPPLKRDINFKKIERPEINFCNENCKITLEMSDLAQRFLPRISRNDIINRRERYRAFLGTWSNTMDGAHVKIEAIYESPQENPFHTYQEGELEIVTDISQIQQDCESLKTLPEYSSLSFIGEVHTHPVFPEDMGNDFKPWWASAGDVRSIVETYEKRILKFNRPFIFAIAAPKPNRDGGTLYRFYRMIRLASEQSIDYRVESIKMP